ncbi:hypothetical protein GIB67_028361 [Kingdonia uniflora]|uniref:Pentatricopeptide repeat-containing protein n=1 Tax=Kingdonia uniflora TaxID=39325 RepID=A0A7J7MHS4_9MAGN|nr:hypothetical protein GIB67_028361 [Kingdonia uniflora]
MLRRIKLIYASLLNLRFLHANSFGHTHHVSLLLSCISTKSLRQTQQIHAKTIVDSTILSSIYLGNLLVEAYFKCGVPEFAFRVLFDEMPERDSFSWSACIWFYSQSKLQERVFMAFRRMIEEGCNPNRSSLISCLSSSAGLSKFSEGRQLHSQIMMRISPSDVIVGNVLINFYSRCGELSEAIQAFHDIVAKDLVSWTSLLSTYSYNGSSKEVWEFFRIMRREDMGFSHYVFSVVAKACGELGDILLGEEVHCLILKAGFESCVITASAVLDMYSKHGMIECSCKIFDVIEEPNVVSWTTIITGYVHTNGVEALKLFRSQIRVGVTPDPHSFSSILVACANIPALEFGKEVHACITKSGFGLQTFTGNSLVGMYSRCGVLSDARKILDSMKIWNVISWTSMITGYAQHGCGLEALEMFKRMREEKIEPNAITFLAVLSACSRSGLVEEGLQHFQSMGTYGVEAGEEHYTCMVDLLARSGKVKEAEEFMKKMPFEPTASAWGALLSGCRDTREIKLGLKCAEELFRLEPNSATNHVLLANMYAANGRWNEMCRIRGMMKEKSLKKERGYSWIEICKNVNVFGVGDQLHPQSKLIYLILHQLALEMEECETSSLRIVSP